jgi:hypothetical protein
MRRNVSKAFTFFLNHGMSAGVSSHKAKKWGWRQFLSTFWFLGNLIHLRRFAMK